jgi:hypothetical protein
MKRIGSPAMKSPGNSAAGSLMKKLLLSLASLVIFSSAVELIFRIFWIPGTLLVNLAPSDMGDGYYHLVSDRRPAAILKSEGKLRDLKGSPPHYCIITLGESAAAGNPYETELSFSHFLLPILKMQWPDVNWSVVNLSFPCQIHSFALVAARDAEAVKPDCFIIYSGNNELYSHNLYYARQRMSGIGRYLDESADFFRRHSSFLSALSSLVYGFQKTPGYAQSNFDREKNIDSGIENYEWLSEKIIDVAHRSRSRVLFCMPLINLRDFPPLPEDEDCAPLTTAQAEALDRCRERAASDSFRLARYFEILGNPEKAKALYGEASDKTDRFGRVHSRILAYIRSTSRHRDVTVIDLERRLNIPLPGDEELVDWCHPKVEMNYRIALSLAAALSPELTSKFGLPCSPPPSFQDTLERVTCNVKMRLADGNCEAGHLNTDAFRWRLAKKYYERSIELCDYEFPLTAHVGHALSCLQLDDKESAGEIARMVGGRSSKTAIRECILTYFNYDNGSTQRLLELFGVEAEGEKN